MPKLSPTMETGVIAQWLVKVGDQIKKGDILAVIETDKATMQMKSYEDGTIVHIDHQAGEEVALGQRVLVLAKKGQDPNQVAAGLGEKGVSTSATTPSVPVEAKTASKVPSSSAAGSDNGQQETDTAKFKQSTTLRITHLSRKNDS